MEKVIFYNQISSPFLEEMGHVSKLILENDPGRTEAKNDR